MYHKYFKKHVNIKQIEDEFKKKKVHEEGLKWFITTTINCDFAQVIESLVSRTLLYKMNLIPATS